MGAILGFLCSEAILRPSLWGPGNLATLLYLDAIWGMLFAGWLGIGIGAVDGVADQSWVKVRRGILLGAVLGMGAGAIGLPAAELFFRWGHQTLGTATALPRSLGWAIMGGAIGSVQGAARNSLTTLWHGLVGGIIGGVIGGIAFETAAGSSESDIIARLVGTLALGLAVGFAIGLVQEVFKDGWLTALTGRAEGRTYFLDKPVTTMGRHELCDISIFEDPSVAPKQAEIRKKAGGYEVVDVAGNGQLAVNLKQVSSAPLGDGFLLQVGKQRFVMQIKGAAAPLPHRAAGLPAPDQLVTPSLGRQTVAPPVMGEGICQFCGGRKDPVTGACACTPQSAAAESGQPEVRTEWFGAGNKPPRENPRLVGVNGSVAGKHFQLDRPMVLIGRHSDNNIVLADDSSVSRFHARVSIGQEGATIYDEGSSNGTFVNGEKVYRRLLRSGDTITLGKSEFRFEDTGNGGRA